MLIERNRKGAKLFLYLVVIVAVSVLAEFVFTTAYSGSNDDPVSENENEAYSGDFTADINGRISRGGDLVYGGVQIVKTTGLYNIKETVFSLNELWNQMHDASRLFALQYPGDWCDVGYPEGIEVAENLLKPHDV